MVSSLEVDMAGEEVFYVGVDVGTCSVRAALVQQGGTVTKVSTAPIKITNPKPDFYEQNSCEIWEAACRCVKEVTAGVADKQQVRGVGFDATCSLVVLDKNLSPVTVSPCTGMDNLNIIMWMDHRAEEEADFINSHQHGVLKYVGGKISLEMQTPKLLWLKKHMKETWSRAAHFFDLPDFLTFKASGSVTRSLCSAVCKWTYQHDRHTQGWDLNFFKEIGLEDLAEDNWKKIGQKFLAPGTSCGYLTAEAAEMMGLSTGASVASSLIDAHAGGLALLTSEAKTSQDVVGRLAMICGTSTCHMSVSEEAIFCPGVWGPYLSSMLPGWWGNEAGQSATGLLVDHVINTHPARGLCTPGKSMYEWLEELLVAMAKEKNLSNQALLTQDLHVYPDFHGNRSPLADPTMKGMISGLTLDSSERSLALLYLATIQGLAYETRQIISRLTSSGFGITSVLMCGGLSKSPTFIQTHADVIGVPVLVVRSQETVLVGSATLAAAASADYPDLMSAALSMSSAAASYLPSQSIRSYHDKKYQVFTLMQENQSTIQQLMSNVKA